MPTEPVPANLSLDRVDPAWAWSAYEPSADAPWNLQRASHLFRRAGFAAPWSQLQWSLKAGCRETVDLLLAGGPETESLYREFRSMAEVLRGSNSRLNLPAWWLYVMLRSPHPLLEKMTLFWHGHFATSAAKVTDAQMMYRQNELLREHALGKFSPMLTGIAKDPAMLVWLDSVTNRKTHPNENFAREVMELFGLGIGNYTEKDIQEAARAFTGWELRQGEFRVNRHQHDEGLKMVLGAKGKWNGDDVVRILLDQPAAGRFLTRKIFRYFVSDEPEIPAKLIEPLAEGLRKHGYDSGWLVRTILSSNLFYSSSAIGQKIKAPVEFAIGLVRSLEGTSNAHALVDDLSNLGQAVFFPPTVKGWDGGADWINSSTLVGRANLVWALVGNADGRYTGKILLTKLSALKGVDTSVEVVRRLVDLLLGTTLPDDVYVKLTSIAGDKSSGDEHQRLARIVQAIATLPEFQLA